jgi:carbonic anhydrase
MMVPETPSMSGCLSAFVIAGLFLCCCSQAIAGTDSVAVVNPADWSYEGPTGPEYWAGINPLYAKCGSGKAQSPINIPVKGPFIPGAPNIKMVNSKLEFRAGPNSFGFTCDPKTDTCGNIQYRGLKFSFKSIHVHSPSEHWINGVQFPLEMHFVHNSSEGRLAVLGVLFDHGKNSKAEASNNPDLDMFLNSSAAKQNTTLSLKNFFNPKARLCTVKGSLTAPPCAEPVTWFISSGVQHVSKSQLARFEALQGSKSSRPLQALNGRTVQCFH